MIIITENIIAMPRYKIKWYYFIWFLLKMMFGVSWSLIIISQHSRMKWRFSPYEKLNNTCTLIGSYIWSIEWQTHSWHSYFQYSWLTFRLGISALLQSQIPCNVCKEPVTTENVSKALLSKVWLFAPCNLLFAVVGRWIPQAPSSSRDDNWS